MANTIPLASAIFRPRIEPTPCSLQIGELVHLATLDTTSSMASNILTVGVYPLYSGIVGKVIHLDLQIAQHVIAHVRTRQHNGESHP